ncbi:MAG: hypothetical protein U0556_17145 [Dehalococcoidia bacterium]
MAGYPAGCYGTSPGGTRIRRFITAIREAGLLLAWWPLALGLFILAAETGRGRADLRLVGVTLLLGMLLTAIGLILFDAGETLRRLATSEDLVSGLIADLAIVALAILLTPLSPWNALPAIAIAAVALTMAFAHLGVWAAVGIDRRAPTRKTVGILVAVVVVAICGGSTIAASALLAVRQGGIGVLSLDLPAKPNGR